MNVPNEAIYGLSIACIACISVQWPRVETARKDVSPWTTGMFRVASFHQPGVSCKEGDERFSNLNWSDEIGRARWALQCFY